MKCCYCGSTDRLHVYGETDPGQSAGLELPMPVYACQSCDPVDYGSREQFQAAVRWAMELRRRFLNGDTGARSAMEGAAAVACDMYNARARNVAQQQGIRPPAPQPWRKFMGYMARIRF